MAATVAFITAPTEMAARKPGAPSKAVDASAARLTAPQNTNPGGGLQRGGRFGGQNVAPPQNGAAQGDGRFGGRGFGGQNFALPPNAQTDGGAQGGGRFGGRFGGQTFAPAQNGAPRAEGGAQGGGRFGGQTFAAPQHSGGPAANAAPANNRQGGSEMRGFRGRLGPNG